MVNKRKISLSRDITGQVFNRLTAVSFVRVDKNRNHLWLFKCVCGEEIVCRKTAAISGASKSCGCLQKEAVSAAATKHRLSKHPLFKIFQSILSRCNRVENYEYPNYGGRGVKVCQEWATNFKMFYDWAILNGWKRGMQIDKDILSKKLGLIVPVYSPETCCVITPKVNSNHTKRNRKITHNGQTKTLAEWQEDTGIPQNTILYRIKYGWDIGSALTIPTTKTGKRKCQLLS